MIASTHGNVNHSNGAMGHLLSNNVSAALASLPGPVDPRGLFALGVTGLGVSGIAWLMGRSGQFPRGLSYWGYLLAVLLVVSYLGRLIILDTKNPVIVVDGVLSGFVVNPVWYLWLGVVLWRGRSAVSVS